MGNWTIVIEGVGAHHNTNNPDDANVQGVVFVEKLRNSGQRIRHASFTFGSVQSLESTPDLTDELNAGLAYEAYCRKVGGKAFNGDPLPDWDSFRADPKKKPQSDAWVEVASTLRWKIKS